MHKGDGECVEGVQMELNMGSRGGYNHMKLSKIKVFLICNGKYEDKNNY